MIKTIGIFGAGWLGKSLALHLQDNDFNVKVSVSSIEKKEQLLNQQLNAFVIKVTEDDLQGDEDFFEKVDVLLVSLPPVDVSIFEMLIKIIPKYAIKKVILFSSTGIYTDCEGIVNEDTSLQKHLSKVHHLKAIEDLFLNENAFNTTVLRLGGLVGADRNPVYHLAKKEVIANANEPVNLVDKAQVLQTIFQLLNLPFNTTVFNVVSNNHQTKKDYYTQAAKGLNVILPPFLATPKPKNRIVSTQKLTTYLNKKS